MYLSISKIYICLIESQTLDFLERYVDIHQEIDILPMNFPAIFIDSFLLSLGSFHGKFIKG